jgi:hypothetical protein
MPRTIALLATLLVVAGLLVVADVLVTRTVEDGMSQRISRALDAPADAELRGWPASWHILSGVLPDVQVRSRDVPLGGAGAVIGNLDVQLTDVEVRWADLTGDADDLPPAATANFEARLDRDTAQALLGIDEEIVALELRDGRIALDVVGVVEMEAAVEAEEGIILVRPLDAIAGLVGLAEIPIDLSDQPGRPHVREARVTPHQIVLTGYLDEMNRERRD